ncbi:response regulator transcription factor [Candidatus Cyanaurora vandensis]|uniref:response regulator n=1 Tax=Candidatus Cyanaurora vandensis TaxID=2714958 RepID=UPI00257EA6FD|nr:response regulator transcription factor [Candidatus Cyanaurora vandensis]
MQPIRILITDDHTLFRFGLRFLIKDAPDLELVGEAAQGEEALRLCQELKPDLVLMDVSLPGMDGMDVTRQLKQQQPDLRVLFLTMHEEESYLLRALAVGGDGYLLKDAQREELLAGIRSVAMGRPYFSPAMYVLLTQRYIQDARHHIAPTPQMVPIKGMAARLTQREQEVLQLIVAGQTNAEIARHLFISPRTVDTHRTNLMHKLNIHNTAGLVRFALEQAAC